MSSKAFDFLVGQWKVENKVLNERFVKSEDWYEFEASLKVEKRAFGQVDKFAGIRQNTYFEGMTLRIFNPETDLWSLYWTDNWTPVLQPPLIGGFKNGVGKFYAKDLYNGRSIDIRFIWRDCESIHPIWEQAFSIDGGKTWEINWVMNFEREK